MGWTIPAGDQQVYSRNTLVTVVAQLKFQPVLKMPAYKDEFQDRVRREFPAYEERVVRQLAVSPETDAVFKGEERSFGFRDKAGTTVITLASESLAIETSRYEHHDRFLGAFDTAVRALVEVCTHIDATRLGLRYINVIKRDEIEAGLDRTVGWSDLVDQSLLQLPASADLEDLGFKAEITAPVTPGILSLRHGLIRPDDQPAEYRIDIDRYHHSDLVVEDTMSLLKRFSDDCFGLFQQCIGESLEEWMSMDEAPREVADA